MSGRIFTAAIPVAGIAVTAEVDLFELIAPNEGGLRLLGLFLGQETEEGAAEHEVLPFSIQRRKGAFTGGSGGSTITPTPVDQEAGTVATGCTVEAMNTTRATGGTGEVLHTDSFEVFTGIGMWLPPALQFTAKGTDALIVGLEKAPADSVTFNGTVYFEI